MIISYKSPVTMFCLLLALVMSGMASYVHGRPVPERQGYITDKTGTLQPRDIADINDQLRRFHQRQGPEIAVLVIPSMKGEIIEKYSLRTAKAWGLGNAKRNDGVLLLLSQKERRVRIEVGTGLEQQLSNERAGKIIHGAIVPFLKRDQYDLGIRRGLHEIKRSLRKSTGGVRPDQGTTTPDLPPTNKSDENSSMLLLGFIAAGFVIVLLFGFFAIRFINKTLKGGTATRASSSEDAAATTAAMYGIGVGASNDAHRGSGSGHSGSDFAGGSGDSGSSGGGFFGGGGSDLGGGGGGDFGGGGASGDF